MSLACLEAITTILLFFGYTYCCRELNGTISDGKTILKGILFECTNNNNKPIKYSQKLGGEKNCESYLAITIKTVPNLHTNRLHQFLTLDQIYVANRFSIAKLLAPYVIEIIRGEPLMMCSLDYDKSVTATEFESGIQIVNGNRYMNSSYQEANNFLYQKKSKHKFISTSAIQDAENEALNNEKQPYRYEDRGGHGNENYENARKYSVFKTNLAIPFLVTTVKIFQKRYSTWWKLAPSVTVDSYSGFYANGNVTVWLKYHTNIFHLSKSINRLKNYKLLIPAHGNSGNLDNILEPEIALMAYYPQNLLVRNEFKSNHLKPLEKSLDVIRAAQSQDIKATTYLENCPYNSSILCINILDDVVAGYSLKIRLPFLENAYIKPNVFKVKIINAVTDATVKDVVKVSITLVNEGFVIHEFAVNIDCLDQISSNQANNIKQLLPHAGEIMEFFLPFIFKKSNKTPKKSYCKIQVKTVSMDSTKRDLKHMKYAQMVRKSLNYPRIVTTRKITVIQHQRCLCVWKCRCHCLSELETNDDLNVCQELDSSAQSKAGLLTNSNYYELNENDSEDTDSNILNFIVKCFWLAILIVVLMGFLGFCKAIVGICIPFVDKWGYDYLQPGRKYIDTSKFRHFLINLFYFILLPFLICCNCFTPSAEDLLIANSENFITKMYIYVYEVFYDNNFPTVIIIEEIERTSQQTDEY